MPCGGGVAFRGLRPDQRVRHLAVDLDQGMLSRARARADRAGLDQIEMLPGDMHHLPLEDAAADLCLTYSGLHMISDPEVAIDEMARGLRPADRSWERPSWPAGADESSSCSPWGPRTGHAAPDGTSSDLMRWLGQAGFTDVDVSGHNAFVLFRARRI